MSGIASTIAAVRSAEEWKTLDQLINYSYDQGRMSQEDVTKVINFVAKLETTLAETIPGTNLHIFGSFRNGFGTKSSDLDLTYCKKGKLGSGRDISKMKTRKECDEILSRISVDLRKAGIGNKLIHAKIPIVKCFPDNAIGKTIDISFHNTLPLFNTRLLNAYCAWAPDRVPPLGAWVKRWAKACDICDSYKGSLPSYGWIIMLIHYLQNCSPAVLPRLQTDFGQKNERHLGRNVYFHAVPDPTWTKNTQSVSQLFYGFLDYYSTFNFHTTVIQIRQKQPMLKPLTNGKKWAKPLCIQDPFDLDYNIGHNKKWRVVNHIIQCFKHSRDVFASSKAQNPMEILDECYFGDVPYNVSQCGICSRRHECRTSCPNKKLRHEKFFVGCEEDATERNAANRQRNFMKKEHKRFMNVLQQQQNHEHKNFLDMVHQQQALQMFNNNYNQQPIPEYSSGYQATHWTRQEEPNSYDYQAPTAGDTAQVEPEVSIKVVRLPNGKFEVIEMNKEGNTRLPETA